jgi:hypothetical protein
LKGCDSDARRPFRASAAARAVCVWGGGLVWGHHVVGESGGGARCGCRVTRAHAGHAHDRILAAAGAGGVSTHRADACPFEQGRRAITRGPSHYAVL